MATALRPMQWAPVPPPPGAYGAPLAWRVDQGRRLAPGGGVNAGTGDGPGGAAWAPRRNDPFTGQPGPVYNHHTQGGTGERPSQPYRPYAGITVQVSTWPRPLRAHLAGGSQSSGAPAMQALLARAAALIAARGATTKAPARGGVLAGTGIGSRAGSQIGVSYGQ